MFPNENNDREVQRLIDEEVEDLRYMAAVFNMNINRALKITKTPARMTELIPDPYELFAYLQDTTRSGIVFTHTTLETTLREIMRVGFAFSSEVSDIPLPGRKEKFTMADLLKHKGKAVDEVIEESIDEYLNSLSFNNTNDIAKALQKISVPQETLRQYYSKLDKMTNRRHKIVHEGDIIRTGKTNQLENMDAGEAIDWIKAVHDFCIETINLTIKAIFVPRIMGRIRKENLQAQEEDVIRAISIISEFK
ncbi:MAG: hypothetical protein KJ069_10115 [Anaerolineae bacterium]|nr:hypothetical protein [Anaerolineae bacterium]